MGEQSRKLSGNGGPAPLSADDVLDVAIVGAGAAGVGCGIILHALGIKRFALLERDDVGASFTRWPAETRFLTPSFTSNGFGMLDLNAIALGTSPAYGLQREHPSGPEYADYLQTLAQHFELPIHKGIEVRGVCPPTRQGNFLLETSHGTLQSRFVIWAAGEFQYPRLDAFPGADLCLHSSRVRSWSELSGDEFLILGGYESGIDAAMHLVAGGKRVRVLDAGSRWTSESSDPSVALSPYTHERLEVARASGRLELIGGARIIHVKRIPRGYAVCSSDERRWKTANVPLLATGFAGSLRMVADLFDRREDGQILLTEHDESSRTPGLFVVGPEVKHDKIIFCFIYKFRQRFAVVAHAIGKRLGIDLAPLKVYRERGMFLDDLSCCGEQCTC